MRYALVFLAVLALAALLVGAIKGDIEERKRWEAFKVEHNCVKIAQKDGQVSTGTGLTTAVDSSGRVSTAVTPIVITTPDQVAWSCNDGVTYWKNR